MKYSAIKQSLFSSVREDFRTSDSQPMLDGVDPVVRPKPRRLGLLNAIKDQPVKSLRWHRSHQSEACDSKVGSDVLDIIFAKGMEQSSVQVSSSPPPFFCGSPPSRVANPLIQDARFGDGISILSPLTLISTPSDLSSSSPNSSRKGGCNRASFGDKPAVRIEGFNCLDRDRRNCSIPTLA